jgi:hypothetical protein
MMNSTVFVRPNLKGFLVGAILLLVVQHIITTGHGQARPVPVNARELTSSELQQLVRRAVESPTVELYMRLSHCYEKRGDYKRALQYLRKAERLGQTEPED